MTYASTLDWIGGQARNIIEKLLPDFQPDVELGWRNNNDGPDLPLYEEGSIAIPGGATHYAEYQWEWGDFVSGLFHIDEKVWKKLFSGSYVDRHDEDPDYGLIEIYRGEHEGRGIVVWLWQRDHATSRNYAWGEIAIYSCDSHDAQDWLLSHLKNKAAKHILPNIVPHPNEMKLLEDLGIDPLWPIAQCAAEVHRG